MRLSKKLLAVLLLSLGLSNVSFAKDLNPWRDCGIGAMIFTDVPVGAIISNIIWDLGTTALTSSGMSKEMCEGQKVAAAKFITHTYANLEEQTVKGDGKHLHAMLDILGCDQSSHTGIIHSVRNRFSNTLNNTQYSTQATVAKAEGYYNLVNATIKQNYATQCNLS
ncbi:MAG: DUF3015 family protein [Gammaproteobacteria bacterium]|nr:DUF3015 family protein [Gammaproteobacteria bacterium]